MQAVYRDTATVPFLHPISSQIPLSLQTFDAPDPSSLRDVVHLVDGDRHVREEIASLLARFGMKVVTFASAAECLGFDGRDKAACVILNTQLPGMSGLELQRRLAEHPNPPVIFLSDPCDIASAVCAMKAGAIEFFTRPFDLPALVAAIRTAFAQNRRLGQRRAELAQLRERYTLLTPREREVLTLVVGGLLNKQAAYLLGISEVTVQIHRSQVMRKMQADSFAELVRMSVKLRIPYWRESQPTDRPNRTLSIAGARDRSPTRLSRSVGHLQSGKLASQSVA